ncbi:hypothetical protein GGS23DRAFT_552109 [Durotheca rogersii]|uniref:uncharacterized protein n=1 Tax=Durotheca rogersii TaxID=419775 RepID=UPI00221F5AE6|nr:uncharacterized protein GGS23DRAFT_552109 [Durotheca rogersii]KAI5866793.1 hypothetical protein GGS23DRAFT_552109 [Durotheca rogersii]
MLSSEHLLLPADDAGDAGPAADREWPSLSDRASYYTHELNPHPLTGNYARLLDEKLSPASSAGPSDGDVWPAAREAERAADYLSKTGPDDEPPSPIEDFDPSADRVSPLSDVSGCRAVVKVLGRGRVVPPGSAKLLLASQPARAGIVKSATVGNIHKLLPAPPHGDPVAAYVERDNLIVRNALARLQALSAEHPPPLPMSQSTPALHAAPTLRIETGERRGAGEDGAEPATEPVGLPETAPRDVPGGPSGHKVRDPRTVAFPATPAAPGVGRRGALGIVEGQRVG